MEIVISQMGAVGHATDFHAYTCEKSASFCAASAWWNRQEVKEIMIQFMKNEALVIDNSQLNTSAPLPEECISFGPRECDCEARTVQVEVSQQQSCSTRND